ncbi:MAG: CDP-alcohol phosphatidyltransferase family protein [Chloroflexi bacterium]|nr:CDP-alcohol phosphatidyltransferase family protein [Chloroflexota bacterium]
MSPAAPALLAWFKPRVRHLAEPLARLLVRLGVSANALTLASVLANGIVAALLSQSAFVAAGLLLLVGNSLDFLDGAVARASGQASDFGAFLDSVCDRYSELLVFFGLVLWYGGQGDQVGLALAFLAAAGSLLVSYARARAESLGYGGEVGLAQRPERIVLLGVGMLLGPWLLFWVLALLAVLTNLTALQRILHVRRLVAERERG